MPLPRAVQQFIADLRADLGDEPADLFEQELEATDLAADGCIHHHNFFAALEWIISQPRTVQEKIEAIGKILAMPRTGMIVVRLPQDVGW
jgi:hypothetical protein